MLCRTTMEFLSHAEKNSVCDSRNTSGLDSAASILGFPFNAGTMNASTLENLIQLYHNNMAAAGLKKAETQSCEDGVPGISMSQQAAHVNGCLSSTVNSEATSVTTKALATPCVGSTSSAYLSVNGATGKVSKKRSRASRRAPTTLLSTDASNFRAMVQQFTGIPEPPFWSGSAEQGSHGPLLARHVSLLPFQSFPPYHNYRPQQYPSFPFPPALREDINPVSSRAGLLDDVGLNSSYSPVFSSSMTLPSGGRAGYPM